MLVRARVSGIGRLMIFDVKFESKYIITMFQKLYLHCDSAYMYIRNMVAGNYLPG